MSRPIKFRAWDKEIKEMYFQDSNTTKPNGIMSCEFSFDEMGINCLVWFYGGTSKLIKNFELMQFIGLKDKNSKEIYKGDKVHCKMISADRTHYLDDYIATVEDDICNPCFVLMQANGNIEYDFIKCNLMELEVIGNIYENASLLEVQP